MIDDGDDDCAVSLPQVIMGYSILLCSCMFSAHCSTPFSEILRKPPSLSHRPHGHQRFTGVTAPDLHKHQLFPGTRSSRAPILPWHQIFTRPHLSSWNASLVPDIHKSPALFTGTNLLLTTTACRRGRQAPSTSSLSMMRTRLSAAPASLLHDDMFARSSNIVIHDAPVEPAWESPWMVLTEIIARAPKQELQHRSPTNLSALHPSAHSPAHQPTATTICLVR